MKKKVLMCGSALSNGGGVVAVTQNLLHYPDWNGYEIEYIPTHINGSAKAKISYFISGFKRIKQLVKRDEVAVAHLHTCDGGPFYRKGLILRYLKKHKIKVVLHHHTDYTEFFSTLHGIKRNFIKKTLKISDANIVLGKSLLRAISMLEPKAKIHVIYNGIEPKATREYNIDGDYILFMGWLIERKGILDLLDAIKSIDSVLDEKYKLALCGLGDEDMVSRIKNSEVGNRIGFLGWADEKTKEEILANTAINVLPSYREGAPMTILEAMAYGIPCVASSISTIPEIIQDGKTGVLLKNHDAVILGRKLLDLLSEPIKREFISLNAYEMVNKKFSIQRQVESIVRLYDSLM